MIASASGCQDDSNTQNVISRRTTTSGGHGAIKRRHGQAGADGTHLERPRSTQADIGEVAPGRDRDGEPDGAQRGDETDLARREAAAGEDHRDERVQDAQRDAEGGDDDVEGQHPRMVSRWHTPIVQHDRAASGRLRDDDQRRPDRPPRQRSGPSIRRPMGRPRHLAGRPPRRGPGPPGPQRRGQDDDRPDAHRAHRADRGHGRRSKASTSGNGPMTFVPGSAS